MHIYTFLINILKGLKLDHKLIDIHLIYILVLINRWVHFYYFYFIISLLLIFLLSSIQYYVIYFFRNNGGLKFLSGSLAGVTSQTLTYPLDLARARMAVSTKDDYKSLGDVKYLILNVVY